jgi:hypothetical protein
VAISTAGDLLIFKVNEFEALLLTRVDVRVRVDRGGLMEEYCQPKSMELAGCRVVITYEESCVLQLLQFSLFNPQQHKQVVLSDIFDQLPFVRACHSVRISKDGCSLAALFLLDPQAQPPAHPPSLTSRVIATLAEPFQRDFTQTLIR